MKTILYFIKSTITGGLLFLIPLVLIVIVITKAFNLLRPLVEGGVARLHIETMMGVAVLSIITILLLVLLCFIAGLLIRLDKMSKFKSMTEHFIVKFVPGFKYLEAVAGEQVAKVANAFRAVLLRDGDAWVVAFIVEQDPNGYTTVFIPEAPWCNSGTTKMLLSASLSYHDLSTREALNCLRRYGAGSLEILSRQQHLEDQANRRPVQ